MSRIVSAALIMCFVSGAALADTDSLAILKADDSSSIRKTTDVIAGQASYAIDVCPSTTHCDRFSAGESQLQGLADFVFLYSIYMPNDLTNDNRLGRVSIKTPKFVTAARQAKSAESMLAAYAARYSCAAGRTQYQCVLHNLGISAGVMHYKIEYGKGSVSVFWPDPNVHRYIP